MSRRFVLPGFGLTLGFTLVYLALVVLIPLSALVLKVHSGGWDHFWKVVTAPQAIASYKVSFGISFVAALVNGVFGLLAAWVLVRYRFPGRRLLDAIVDLPFALPTAVAGIALTTIYAPHEWIGGLLAYHQPLGHFFDAHQPLGAWLRTQDWARIYLGDEGIKIAYTQLGIFIALTFIGMPFVVRTVQPVIQDLHLDVEEAAACLGATRWQTFLRVILPTLLPAILTGVTLAFGRAVGEYGSVIFIAGNLPFKTEITPVLIVSKLENYDYAGAAGLGFVMLAASFAILLVSNGLQAWDARRKGIA